MSRPRTAKPVLRGDTKRRIRDYVAGRDGHHCHYCARPFAPDLADATLDHYVPYCLWPMNRPRNLVLACEPCNQAKADRLPLPLALILAARTQAVNTVSAHRVHDAHRVHGVSGTARTAVHGKALTSVTTHVTPGVTPRTSGVRTPNPHTPHTPYGRCADRPHTPHGQTVNTVDNSVNMVDGSAVHGVSTVFTGPSGYALWLMLARFAAARESAARSPRGLHESAPHDRGIHPGPQGDAPDRPAVSTGPRSVSAGESVVSADRSIVSARERVASADRSGGSTRLSTQTARPDRPHAPTGLGVAA
ncbi:HNH endonuclease [Streptomyces sp. NPDC056672]|uniref:HNH endonuclease n=1 Tax=Streptomyces sp. NPDC056672 TaxID=3345906 RepID=UPI0036923038